MDCEGFAAKEPGDDKCRYCGELRYQHPWAVVNTSKGWGGTDSPYIQYFDGYHEGTVDVKVCSVCAAIVAKEMTDVHREFHNE